MVRGSFMARSAARTHWVIIHAPLYYRLAALLAWPLVRLRDRSRDGGAGGGPITLVPGARRDTGGGLSYRPARRSARDGGMVGRAPDRGLAGRRRHAIYRPARHAGDRAPYHGRSSGPFGLACGTAGAHASCRRLTRRLGWPSAPSNISSWPRIVSTFLLLAACMRGRLSARYVVAGWADRPGHRADHLRC